jgi:hypothetical protein
MCITLTNLDILTAAVRKPILLASRYFNISNVDILNPLKPKKREREEKVGGE